MTASAFERLSPALQYQIVNDLGWDGLRPVQELTTEAILDGNNCVVLAPTAGGKTEASLFPLLSLMDLQERPPVSVLYIAPIRALLNNQEHRLNRLTGLIGRRAFKWHGDVSQSAKKRFLKDPTDILSITPESLEAMLMSARVPAPRILGQVQAVVIDEVHAFAADDRGAHLMAVLERITRICDNDIQRIGLSATVGDPEVIVEWLSGSSLRPQKVIDPGGVKAKPDLLVDWVKNIDNAAIVIDKLYAGTRRLVFVDSRRRVEALGDSLAQREVDVYVSHSSLAVGDREAAEKAFEEGQNCVIVATSALELGIDVGDLEHVLQIDAPTTVSSFLQRMGRTGRRPGTQPNCTFLGTKKPDRVVQAAALIRLMKRGYVEPAAPSFQTYHVLAHQLLALSLQEFGVETIAWWNWLEGCSSFRDITEEDREAVLKHMLAQDILVENEGRLLLGKEGEKFYAGRNFMELYAVFSTPPVFKVIYGNREVGTVDLWFLMNRDKGPLCFVLGGERWQVVDVQWKRGLCIVKRAEQAMFPRWAGQPVMFSRDLCQTVREILTSEEEDEWWSSRAREIIADRRSELHFLKDFDAPLLPENSQRTKLRWWTFAGGRANALLAAMLQTELGDRVSSNNFYVTFSERAAESAAEIRMRIHELTAPGALDWDKIRPLAAFAGKTQISKFQPCLPAHLEQDLLARYLFDREGARQTAAMGAVTIDWEE